MTRWLALAEWLCGEHARRTVFEPLVADWQRQLHDDRDRGWPRRAVDYGSGVMAFIVTLVGCAMTTGRWLPNVRAAAVALLTFVVALTAALVVLWVLSLPSGVTTEIDSVRTQSFLLSFAGLAGALVLLPMAFILRRDPRLTSRHAVTTIGLGALLVAGLATATSQEALNAHFSTFEWVEREYQRALANDRAGRVTYPGTARRELRGPSTIEERRANHERFMMWQAGQEARRPPLTMAQRLRRMQPAALAVVFGVMGWTLAGLGPVTLSRAAMWWALMFLATLAFGVMPRALTGVAMPILPHTYALPLFGVITVALVAASWKQAPAPTAPTAPQAPQAP
jgi:hypothetical protein